MSELSPRPPRGKSIIGMYGYSRGIYSAEGYKWEGMKDFLRVERQLAPQLFLVANLHITDDSVISRDVVTLEHLRQCIFYESYSAANECRDYHVQKAATPAFHMIVH